MDDLKFVVEPWKDFDGSETEAMHINTEELYTISELIALLERAKERWRDKKVLMHEMNSNIIGGFDTIYLHHGFDLGEDYYMDDTICIYG